MPLFRIHKLKESHRQQFRWQPHTSGLSHVKPKDYEPAGSVEASNEYVAWMRLKQDGAAFQVGDLLEVEGVSLRIYKYVGFEEVRWVVPEQNPVPQPESGPIPAQPAGV